MSQTYFVGASSALRERVQGEGKKTKNTFRLEASISPRLSDNSVRLLLYVTGAHKRDHEDTYTHNLAGAALASVRCASGRISPHPPPSSAGCFFFGPHQQPTLRVQVLYSSVLVYGLSTCVLFVLVCGLSTCVLFARAKYLYWSYGFFFVFLSDRICGMLADAIAAGSRRLRGRFSTRFITLYIPYINSTHTARTPRARAAVAVASRQDAHPRGAHGG